MLSCCNMDGKTEMTPSLGHCLCGVCMFSHVSVGFLQGLHLFPTSLSWACEANWHVDIVHTCECVCMCVHAVMKGRPVQDGLPPCT